MPGGDEVESIEVDVSGVHSSVGVGLHSSVRTLFYLLEFSEWILLWMNALKQ